MEQRVVPFSKKVGRTHGRPSCQRNGPQVRPSTLVRLPAALLFFLQPPLTFFSFFSKKSLSDLSALLKTKIKNFDASVEIDWSFNSHPLFAALDAQTQGNLIKGIWEMHLTAAVSAPSDRFGNLFFFFCVGFFG